LYVISGAQHELFRTEVKQVVEEAMECLDERPNDYADGDVIGS